MMIFKPSYELPQLLLFHFSPLHPSPVVSHMTIPFCFTPPSLLCLRGWHWGDTKGQGLLLLTGKAKEESHSSLSYSSTISRS